MLKKFKTAMSLLFIFTFQMLLGLSFVSTSVVSASSVATIAVGQYVQLGKYYDEPIMWRCVDIDENGPLMLSDKILCLKAFDAAGTHPNDYNNYRLTYGSSLWETSNLRSWLNSSATAGNVSWSCGVAPAAGLVTCNEYADEKGFLSDGNFTSNEYSIIKNVEQKCILNSWDKSLKSGGTTSHVYNESIADIVQNYDNAYYKNLSDRMFLLDVKQLNKVWQNLGAYYVAQPTEKAIINSKYINPNLVTDKNWQMFIRTPYPSFYPMMLRRINENGVINYGGANSGNYGVRPAFYLDLSMANLAVGDGSSQNPFILGVSSACDILSSTTPNNATITTNSIKANFSNATSNITVNVTTSENATWKLYSDATCTTEISSKALNLVVGANLAYIKVTAQDGVTTKIYTLIITRDIEVGQYIQFGSYYGEPILWRVINKNADGSLMLLAEKILSIKPFDASGDLTDGRGDADRISSGSNYWEKSNLKEWLNSESQIVNYSHQVPDATHISSENMNDYATETGFLYNFTPSEIRAIQPVTHKSLLANTDIVVNDGGTEPQIYNSSIASVSQNYHTAYYKSVDEKVFLLDEKELHDYVYAKGYDYLRKPTTKAVLNSEFKFKSLLNDTNNWNYWLRSPYADTSSNVRYVSYNGGVYDACAYNIDVGVVPALNLKADIVIDGGDGSIQIPYIVTDSLPINTNYEISNLSFVSTQGNGSVTLNIKNKTLASGTVNIIYAVYKDKKLINSIISNQSFMIGETKPLQQSITITNGAWDIAKVFVWDDITKISPLSTCAEFVNLQK